MATEKFIQKAVLSELVEYTGSNVAEIASLTMESCWEAYQINPLNVENQFYTSLPEGEVEGTAEGEYTKYLFFPYQTYYVPVGGYAGMCGGVLCLHFSRAEVLSSMEVYPPA
jgi:hypothetical protein